MLTIRKDQFDTFVVTRQQAFVNEMVRKLQEPAVEKQDSEQVASWVSACLALALRNDLNLAGDAAALVLLLAHHGRPDPGALPSLAYEVLQANAVPPALKLAMLADVLAMPPHSPQP